MALAVLALAFPAGAARSQTVEARPADVLEGEPIDVVVSGLAPGQAVTIHASRVEDVYPRGNAVFRSRANFTADATGRIDLGSAAPAPGSSYDRPDRAGLFWSMARAPRDPTAATRPVDPRLSDPAAAAREGRVVLEVEADGRIVARSEVRIRPAAVDVTVTDVRDAEVIGVFARNLQPGPRPAVIVLGGSEGGLFTARWLAPILASRGYAVLGLAYFEGGETDLPGLSPNLELIPLERLEAARRWLAEQPGVDASRVAVVGVSKGAELALLAGATYDWVAVVAAFAPSHLVWEGIPPDEDPYRDAGSSWTLDGRPLPFVRWSQAAQRRGEQAEAATGASRLVEVHLESLAEHPEDIEAATIPVERSRAAVFIAAGIDDGMWPAAWSAERLRGRLSRRPAWPPAEIEIVDTGHEVLGSGWAPTTTFHRATGMRRGGSPRLDAEAQALLWPRFLHFLDRHMGQLEPEPTSF